MKSGIYDIRTNRLYKEINQSLFENTRSLVELLDENENLFYVVLSSDLDVLSTFYSDFFNECSNIVEVLAEDYRYDFPFRFDYCDNLQKIYLPDELTGFNAYNLAGSKSLRSLYISENNKYFKSIDGVLYSKDEHELIYLPSQAEYKIGDKVERIGNYALCEYFKVNEKKAAFVPYGIKSLGEYSFGTVNTIYLPNTLEELHSSFVGFNKPATIYCSEKIKELVEATIGLSRAKNINFKRLTLDDLIKTCSINETNELLKAYGDNER